MRSFAIFGRDCPHLRLSDADQGELEIEGMPVFCGVVEMEPPGFDPRAQPDQVYLRVLAFSLNYRDRGFILRMCASDRQDGLYVIGSDFVAEVLDIGENVTDLTIGDRVIPDCQWPPVANRRAGIPSNHASREIQVLPRQQLMRIPPGMDIATAASFSVGAQTAFAMIRRLNLAVGDRVLVTAPHSNTSLFVIGAMALRGVEIHGVSTSGGHRGELLAMGLAELIEADPWAGPFDEHPGFTSILADGGFQAVVDPFSDLYLALTTPLLAYGGRYITCGREDQSSGFTGRERTPTAGDARATITTAMLRNLSIIGNCLGASSDLARALAEHAAGRFSVRLDSVHRSDPAGFLERTYNAHDRFGKVAFLYA
jgi:NADPH:quinone reductase-like Zn-dependent oxidoreductase